MNTSLMSVRQHSGRAPGIAASDARIKSQTLSTDNLARARSANRSVPSFLAAPRGARQPWRAKANPYAACNLARAGIAARDSAVHRSSRSGGAKSA